MLEQLLTGAKNFFMPETVPGRRAVLKYTALMFSAVAFPGCLAREKRSLPNHGESKEPAPLPTLADTLLDQFPTEILGAAHVKKYAAPGAQHVLVHVRNLHSADKLSDKKLQEVVQVQHEVYTILSYLVDNASLRDVYIEGMCIENNNQAFLNKARRNYLIQRKSIADWKKEYKDKGVALPKDIQRFVKEREAYVGSFIRLFAEGKLNIKPAEKRSVRELEEKLRKKDNLQAEVVLMDGREDAALDIISKNKDKLAVIVYGGRHAWGGLESCDVGYYSRLSFFGRKDNIAEWNKEHPYNKFSLIEITPKTYAQLEKRQRK